MVTTVRFGLRQADPCLSASKTHLDVRAVACVHIGYQRRDSAAVSLKAKRQQYRSIQRNPDKVILCGVTRSQHDGRQIGPRSRRQQAPVISGGPSRTSPLSSHCLKADQRKGDQEAATSIKHVCIESRFAAECNGEERGAMKTAVKDAALSDTEAIYLASVILGVAWLFV